MQRQAMAQLIGAVAKEAGLPVKTIRYYDEIGLLKTLGRTAGGYRLFAPDVQARLGFIKRAQALGLSLSEIKDFLALHDQGDLPCDQIKAKLEAKLADIEHHIAQLQLLRQELAGLLSGWAAVPARSPQTICPILEDAAS